jgi:hypothetical protein
VNTNAFPLDTIFTNVSAGSHILTINNVSFSCSIDVPITISAPGFPLQALVSNSTNTCYGDTLAFAVASSAGGTPGYTYEWFDSGLNSFSTSDSVFGLTSGSYFLEVMDANGCDTFTTVNVIEPTAALNASPQVFNVSCKGGSSGMIVGDASGSWAPYIYEWFDQDNVSLQPSSGYTFTRDTLKDLIAGIYFLTLTDAQGCTLDYTFNIDESDEALSIDSVKVISPIACYGDSVGIARLYASGGDPVYSYLWDNGETGLIATNLSVGFHTVSLTDDWGCVVDSVLYMPENTLIESDLVVDLTVSCYGNSDGIASISSFGGASSVYTYFWSQGQTTIDVNSDVATGLLQGSYYVTTRDVLGCEVVDTIYISHPEPLTMEASELDWIDCFGANDGEGFAVAYGGTAPYLFDWDADGFSDGDTLTTLSPGLHTVVATDARGCTATDTILTHEPLALVINIDDNQTVYPYCLGVNTASLTAIASGGTVGYSYEWDDNFVQPQITATATSLLAGTYTVTATDSKGCTASDTRTLINTSTMDATVSSLITYVGGNDVSCYGANDGKALVSVLGAHAPYSYQWYGPNGYTSVNDTVDNLTAGVYSVVSTDTNGCTVNSSVVIEEPSNMLFTTIGVTPESCLGACDGEIGLSVLGGISPYVVRLTETTTGNVIDIVMNNNVVSGICSGTYALTITDVNGCSSTLINGGVDQQTIVASNTTVAQINTSNIVSISCNGAATGELEVLNPNTNFGYSYSWQDLNGNEVGTSTTASNLLSGTYVLYAHYNNTSGCTTTDTAIVAELSIIDPTVVITNIDCFGDATGVLQSSAQGGVAPYNMLWNPGNISGSGVSGLQAGSYTLTVTDNNNCSEIDTFEVTQPQELLTSISQNGYVLTAGFTTGGTPGYSYSWRKNSSPNISLGSDINYVVSSDGIYYVLVTDANNCISQSNFITYNEGPLSTADLDNSINLNVYPNPFREETTVDFGRRINEATVRIVDVYGKLVELYDIVDTDTYIIKRTNKASGIYFMEIEVNKNNVSNIKLIIK